MEVPDRNREHRPRYCCGSSITGVETGPGDGDYRSTGSKAPVPNELLLPSISSALLESLTRPSVNRPWTRAFASRPRGTTRILLRNGFRETRGADRKDRQD